MIRPLALAVALTTLGISAVATAEPLTGAFSVKGNVRKNTGWSDQYYTAYGTFTRWAFQRSYEARVGYLAQRGERPTATGIELVIEDHAPCIDRSSFYARSTREMTTATLRLGQEHVASTRVSRRGDRIDVRFLPGQPVASMSVDLASAKITLQRKPGFFGWLFSRLTIQGTTNRESN
ncbi:MAG: hypothetical protein IT371_04685 [Deltaproteobacteria bacterium]|nr:hypothetical protein [Deltaproteobacteria bacterium]